MYNLNKTQYSGKDPMENSSTYFILENYISVIDLLLAFFFLIYYISVYIEHIE